MKFQSKITITNLIVTTTFGLSKDSINRKNEVAAFFRRLRFDFERFERNF
jgi:hypothetical protein